MKLLPAIDLLKGKVVTLVGGVPGTQTSELPDPRKVFSDWVEQGAEWIHVVDLDAAFNDGDHRMIIEDLLQSRRAKVQVGGGIRSSEKVHWLLKHGAERVIVGTKGIEDPGWLAGMAGEAPDQIVLAVDAKDGKIVTRGWTKQTTKDVVQVVRSMSRLPLAGFLFTSVGVEGQLKGIDHDAIVQVFHASSLPLIVAGGVTSYDDLKFLKRLGVDGVVLGAALYQGRIGLPQARNLVEEV